MQPFKVGISFAGAQRDYAEKLKNALQSYGVAIFYDNDFRHELWGQHLNEKFHEIFGELIEYAIVLVSKEYVERVWPRAEARIIFDRAMKLDRPFILPIRFDDSKLPGLVDTVHYEKASELPPQAAAQLFCKMAGIDVSAVKASQMPPPQMANVVSDLEFDYTNHNGAYIIGHDQFSFETRWANSGGDSIQAGDAGKNIWGIAVAEGAQSLADISDASSYDFSSPWRRVKIGELLVLKNNAGIYCVVKILGISAKSHGADKNRLKIFYVIDREGSADFRDWAFLE